MNKAIFYFTVVLVVIGLVALVLNQLLLAIILIGVGVGLGSVVGSKTNKDK